MRARLLSCAVALLVLILSSPLDAQWKPQPGPLKTKWADKVTPETAHREYPRPQLVRKHWTNLNGLWDYAIRPRDSEPGEKFDGKILVPFPVESSLSGVMKRVSPDHQLWYRREFEAPKLEGSDRLLLHFGAVDWEASVRVNGKEVGSHRGGYAPFTFDITDSLERGGNRRQTLEVLVSDPTDASYQPRGKQVRKPEGIWYTPTTGIWQTVWLEVVPATYLADLDIKTDLKRSMVTITPEVKEGRGVTQKVVVRDGQQVIAEKSGPADRPLEITLKDAKLWSPERPQLYDITLLLLRGDETIDQVDSYFAMRSISLGKDEKGLVRILLNGKFMFQSGPLDQGFWPDGLYTAPSDEALRYDLEVTKKLGFNMVRKHVKVEPARWYRHCDELGLLVWQDMPSGDKYIGANDPDIQRSEGSAKNFVAEWTEIIHDFDHFPCIVMWVPFNEGWGQYATREIAELTKKLDPTRLVNSASGWTDRGVGDVHDVHIYPGPGAPKPEENRAIVLGEFGGLGLPLEGHTWQAKNNWGYRSYKTREELNQAFAMLYDRLVPLITKGLSAAVYTQTTDVEIEVNGLLTYDRAVLKIEPEVAQQAHAGLSRRIKSIKTVIASSAREGQTWRYITDKPADDDWFTTSFDDSKWQEGKGGFGERSTPGSVVRTDWKTPDIWLRRAVEVPERKWQRPMLQAHWDEDSEVYFNGKLAARMSGYTTEYTLVPLTKEGIAELKKPGKLVIAVHTHQTGGGQYIDLGIVDVEYEEMK